MTQYLEQKLREAGAEWRNPSRLYYAIVLPWVVMLLLIIYDARLFHQIAKRQRTTSGTITAHEPEKRERYGYTFSAGGRTYRGWEFPTDNQKWTMGQRVLVYYDPDDPARNALTDFASKSLDARGGWPFLFAGTTFVLLLIFLLRRSAAASRRAESDPNLT